jgi:hypothetical protein
MNTTLTLSNLFFGFISAIDKTILLSGDGCGQQWAKIVKMGQTA